MGLNVFGFIPLFYAIIYYLGDVWTYLTSDDEEELEEVQIWQVRIHLQTKIVKLTYNLFPGISIWIIVVCIYIISITSTFFLYILRVEPDKSLEIERCQKTRVGNVIFIVLRYCIFLLQRIVMRTY